eukprot:205262-Rhodomonas_salina.1
MPVAVHPFRSPPAVTRGEAMSMPKRKEGVRHAPDQSPPAWTVVSLSGEPQPALPWSTKRVSSPELAHPNQAARATARATETAPRPATDRRAWSARHASASAEGARRPMLVKNASNGTREP